MDLTVGVYAKTIFSAANPAIAIQNAIESQKEFIAQAEEAWRYYENRNDILKGTAKEKVDKAFENSLNPLRSADNKISHPFHQLLVDQKTGYLFGKMVLITSKQQQYREQLKKLSDNLHNELMELCIDASNTGVSWLHYFINSEGQFDFVKIPAIEIVPLYSDNIKKSLIGILRHYSINVPGDNGSQKIVGKAELWTSNNVTYYTKQAQGYIADDSTDDAPNPAPHFKKGSNPMSFGRVPFVEFRNNNVYQSDLHKVKALIDVYDKTVSLYSNDIEDLQELIFVLINYGGQSLSEFMSDLKQYKAIKVEKSGSGSDGGVETLKVDIPVEARIKLLEIIKKNIWTLGQGVDPEQFPTNPSGVALRHLYGMLELKASLAEVGFKEGIYNLLQAFTVWLKLSTGADYSKEPVDIIFTRSMISNDTEVIDMCSASKGIISDRTIIANHPWVDDVDAELAELQKQKAAAAKLMEQQFAFDDTGGGADGAAE